MFDRSAAHQARGARQIETKGSTATAPGKRRSKGAHITQIKVQGLKFSWHSRLLHERLPVCLLGIEGLRCAVSRVHPSPLVVVQAGDAIVPPKRLLVVAQEHELTLAPLDLPRAPIGEWEVRILLITISLAIHRPLQAIPAP